MTAWLVLDTARRPLQEKGGGKLTYSQRDGPFPRRNSGLSLLAFLLAYLLSMKPMPCHVKDVAFCCIFIRGVGDQPLIHTTNHETSDDFAKEKQ